MARVPIKTFHFQVMAHIRNAAFILSYMAHVPNETFTSSNGTSFIDGRKDERCNHMRNEYWNQIPFIVTHSLTPPFTHCNTVIRS